MAKVKAVFYLPIRDNDGRDLTTEIEGVRAEVYVRFHGWTFAGYITGAFQMPDGSQSVDDLESYFVIIDDTRVDELEQVLRDFKSKTTQEAIYLEIQRNVDIRFV